MKKQVAKSLVISLILVLGTIVTLTPGLVQVSNLNQKIPILQLSIAQAEGEGDPTTTGNPLDALLSPFLNALKMVYGLMGTMAQVLTGIMGGIMSGGNDWSGGAEGGGLGGLGGNASSSAGGQNSSSGSGNSTCSGGVCPAAFNMAGVDSGSTAATVAGTVGEAVKAVSNGSELAPYALEPNQFQKVCGKNEYVLWWSQRGSDGKDLKDSADKMQNSFLAVPSCEALAQCHCCVNSCEKDKFCFSKEETCDGGNCAPKCQQPSNDCKNYKDPEHKTAFNSDCSCQQDGCPTENAKNCKIILYKSKSAWNIGTYLQNMALKQSKWITKLSALTIINSIPTVFKTESADVAAGGGGWVDKLEQQKGSCCKCVDESKAKEGPQESKK